jgi:condensin complex subunit 3
MGILSDDTVKPEAIISMWTKALKSEDEPEVAAAAAESLAKLMLAGVVTEDEILKVLVETYFDPVASQNEPLKQALSYFFPVFCHSVPDNQYCMARVCIQIYCPDFRLRCQLSIRFYGLRKTWMKMKRWSRLRKLPCNWLTGRIHVDS